MAGLPLSGVSRWSPLGSGGEDPAHPLALRLSEGAVGWAGPPPLSRASDIYLKDPRGGISIATSFKCGDPPSLRAAFLVLVPGGRKPPGAPPPSARGGRSSVVGGGTPTPGAPPPHTGRPWWFTDPSGYGRSAHRVPFARETAIDNFWVSVFPGSGLTQTATSIYDHTGPAGLLPSTDCIHAYRCTEQCRRLRRLAAAGTADGCARGGGGGGFMRMLMLILACGGILSVGVLSAWLRAWRVWRVRVLGMRWRRGVAIARRARWRGQGRAAAA